MNRRNSSVTTVSSTVHMTFLLACSTLDYWFASLTMRKSKSLSLRSDLEYLQPHVSESVILLHVNFKKFCHFVILCLSWRNDHRFDLQRETYDCDKAMKGLNVSWAEFEGPFREFLWEVPQETRSHIDFDQLIGRLKRVFNDFREHCTKETYYWNVD